MRKTLQIVNIDGTEGAGKTTQIQQLAAALRSKGFTVLVNYLNDTISSAMECSDKTNRFIEENPDGIVINDGSIARMMVVDLSEGMSQVNAIDRYRAIIHEHEKIYHKYGTANLLIIMEDLDACNKRLAREAELLKLEQYKKIDPTKEKTIIQGLRRFDANMITNNLKFHTMEIDAEDSILYIKDSILKYLEEHFILKSPSQRASN